MCLFSLVVLEYGYFINNLPPSVGISPTYNMSGKYISKRICANKYKLIFSAIVVTEFIIVRQLTYGVGNVGEQYLKRKNKYKLFISNVMFACQSFRVSNSRRIAECFYTMSLVVVIVFLNSFYGSPETNFSNLTRLRIISVLQFRLRDDNKQLPVFISTLPLVLIIKIQFRKR